MCEFDKTSQYEEFLSSIVPGNRLVITYDNKSISKIESTAKKQIHKILEDLNKWGKIKRDGSGVKRGILISLQNVKDT